MRFLIAGSSGFLGTRLRERLTDQGHSVTSLVRRPGGPGEVTWDPYQRPLDPAVVRDHDVVINLAGSPTAGNVHSSKWARELRASRITTTRVLAEAIAASGNQPTFLAGNGIAYYGDHGNERLTEQSSSLGDALLTRVTREWQEAADPARTAGSRVCVLRTSPVMDRRSQPLKALRLLFKAGLGGPLGDGSQFMPMISTRDWVAALIHLAENDGIDGPVNLVCEQVPTNADFTRELGRLVHRPARFRVPAFVLRPAAGQMANELLGSVNAAPARLLGSGFAFSDPDVGAVLREGLNPTR
ncbi:MAG: TIGR01777 family oxidoreductase [Marmoricola sp.]